MFSLEPPDDNRYDVRDDLEPEWPGELPDYVEEWNQLWFQATQAMRDLNLRRTLPLPRAA